MIIPTLPNYFIVFLAPFPFSCMVALLCTPFLCVFTIQLMVSHVMSSMNLMGIVHFCFGLTCRWCLLCVRHHEVVAVLLVFLWFVSFFVCWVILCRLSWVVSLNSPCILVQRLCVCLPTLRACLGLSLRACFVCMLLEWNFWFFYFIAAVFAACLATCLGGVLCCAHRSPFFVRG